MPPQTPSLTKVQTTLPAQPFPSNAARAPIRTPRLVLRALTQEDLGALHALRTQRAVMARTSLGRPDADLAATQAKLDPFLPPAGDLRTYNPGICLAATGELIGLGGVFGRASALGWPEVGYMIREEHWGRGYATEFLEAFVGAWWALPREEAVAEVDELSVVREGEGGKVREMLCAVVEEDNKASQRVVEKAGFKRFRTWTVESRRAGEEGVEVTLVGFVNRRPEEKAV
ncbi:acyl-CoA N-acyltransferase [Hypoxylon argillaceum]|nr:acyl-CoA N-acyltransferase [Hypoxylon argillaceum]KAI1153824.1 acyl-CoA N-acyltransferase [Nemania diffusa]